MQGIHQTHHDELDQCLVALQGITSMKTKSTMWKFYNNVRLTWVELDNEMVNCRRTKRITQKYTDLEAEFAENIRIFDQWHIKASLMS